MEGKSSGNFLVKDVMANQTQCCNQRNITGIQASFLKGLDVFPILETFPVLIFGVEVG